ncbi:MAG: FtsX-like permease family protein [Actinomycetota bacterium]
MIILLVLAGLLSVVAVHDLIRKPGIRRVALRNLSRRVGEASLVVFGSALGTAIIAGALIVGDTFDNSIRDIARTDLGPIDTVVTVDDPADLDAAAAALAADGGIAGVDGLATITDIRAAIATVAGGAAGEDVADEGSDDRRADPRVSVTAGDFDQLRALGGDSTGLADAGQTPQGDEVVLTTQIADELQVTVGDRVEIFAYGQASAFQVRQVIDHLGVAGWGEAFIDPARFAQLVVLDDPLAAPPSGRVLVSNDGDVFDSTGVDALAGPTADDTIADAIDERLTAAGLAHDRWDIKAGLLEDAEEEGAEITEIFTAVGGFSVLAGVLLLVNLFVMLAEERKTSLGVLRAIGWRRGHLVRSFVLEGAAYGLIASLIGALAGIPVGWVIVKATEQIFAANDGSLQLRLAVEPRSLVIAGLVGLVISLVVSWATSARISRLNIIRAIRDLPEPGSSRRRWLTMVAAVIGVTAGVFLTIVPGIGGESPELLILGAPLALFSAIPLLRGLLPGRRAPRLVPVAAGAAVIAWAVAVFSVFDDVMQDPPIAVFLMQGVLMVAGAVAISASLGPSVARALGMVPGGSGPATRLGLAYPTARGFRTGVSLAMFSLIVFSLTFIAVLSTAFGQQTEAFTDEASSGFDALVRSNPANPIPVEGLVATDEVTDAATVRFGFAEFSAPFDPPTVDEPAGWSIAGIDVDFVAKGMTPELIEIDPAYPTEVAAFEAVATDPSLVIVATWFLGGDDGADPSIGDTVTLWNDAGDGREVTVVGLMENDWVFGGTYASAQLVQDHLGGQFSANRHFVSFADEVSPDDGAALLNGRFVENGADAESFARIVGTEVAEQQGFFNLLSGYLSLGLLIGVAGLGVVMIRAVRERRSQVGMLRAMGMATGGIRSMFLTEGGYVALQGVLSGVLLGLLSSYQLLVRSNTFEIRLDFVVPWLALAVIAALPLLASFAASAIPARRAARIPVATALRLSD